MVLAAITNCFNTIWFCRKRKRFADNTILVRSVISLIISSTSFTGNNAKLHASSSISDFLLLKAFSVKLNFGNSARIKEVIWQPPILNWVKCNIDWGIYINSNADFLGAFACNLGNSNSLKAELNGVMLAIELAQTERLVPSLVGDKLNFSYFGLQVFKNSSLAVKK